MKTPAGTQSRFVGKHLTLAALACVAALVLSSPTVLAKDKSQQRAEARALIQKALDVSDFRAPGSPAFELRGTITIPLKAGQSATGSYLLDWASPDRWREEIHVANYSRIRVGGAGKYWQQRSINYELIPFDSLSHALGYAQMLRSLLADLDASTGSESGISLKAEKIAGREVNCASTHHKSGDAKFCFDFSTGALILTGGKYAGLTSYTGFVDFHGKVLPGIIEVMDGKRLVVSLHLDRVAPISNVDAALFAPLENASVWLTCDTPVEPKLIHQAYPDFRRPGISGTVVAYLVVGTDGAAHDAKILAASYQQDADATLGALTNWRFQPQTCHGVPQPREEIITLTYENQ